MLWSRRLQATAASRRRVSSQGSARSLTSFLNSSVPGSGHGTIPRPVTLEAAGTFPAVRGVAADLGFAPSYTPGLPQGTQVNPEQARALARLGACEALLAGSTLLGTDTTAPYSLGWTPATSSTSGPTVLPVRTSRCWARLETTTWTYSS